LEVERERGRERERERESHLGARAAKLGVGFSEGGFQGRDQPPERCRLLTLRKKNQFEKNYFTEMCSASEAGSYLRLIDWYLFVEHAAGSISLASREAEGRLGFIELPISR